MQLAAVGFYEDHPPPHGHRSPVDLAEDEELEALHGNVCAPGHAELTPTSAPPTDASRSTKDEKRAMTTTQ